MLSATDAAVGVLSPACQHVTYALGRAGAVTLPLYYITATEELPHLDAWLDAQDYYLIDTETSGLDALTDQIATIQFGRPRGPDARLYVLDVRCVERDALVALLRKHLTKRRTKKLGMNVGFECKFITGNFGVPIRGLQCIQVSEQVIRAGLLGGSSNDDDERAGKKNRKAYSMTSMAKLAMFYLGLTIDKDFKLRTSFFSTPPGKHDERQLAYAAGDCVYPDYIFEQQLVELEARELREIAEVEWAVIPIVAEAWLRGMHFEPEPWRALWREAVQKLDLAEKRLDALFLNVQGDLFSGGTTDVRPLYLKGSKPVPLNYASSAHVSWMIINYCKAINWPVEIITDLRVLKKRKLQEGANWIDMKRRQGQRIDEDHLPDFLLPEDRYCILLNTERDTLLVAMCLKQLPQELVEALVDASKYRKLAGTYGLKFLNDNVRADTGRIHVEFHQLTTATGRFAHEPNSANLPSDPRYRKCFASAPGRKLCIADMSQVEPRITAYVSRDPVYMRTYLTNDDIYLAVAEACFGERPDKHTPDGALARQRAKQLVLSLAYRMGKAKFRRKMILALRKEIMAGTLPAPTFHEISALYDKFFEVHEKIHEYQERTANDAYPAIKDDEGHLQPNTRRIWDTLLEAPVTWVEAPCGRKRFFPPDANPYSEAPNVPPQAGSATMLKAAMVLLQEEIDRRGWWKRAGLVNSIHDELVYEVDDEIAAEFAPLLKSCMERAGNHYNGDIPIIAEFPEGTTGVLPYWAKKRQDDMDLDLDEAA